jgi:hypothetical protein
LHPNPLSIHLLTDKMKNQLLEIAAKSNWHHYKRAHALAGLSLSADAIDTRLGVLNRRAAITSAVAKWAYILGCSSVAIAVFALTWGELVIDKTSTATNVIFGGFFSVIASLLTALCIVIVESMVVAWWAKKEEAELLTPIAGTTQCALSLNDLHTGGPNVGRWRDIAIQERGQVHKFDSVLMAELNMAHSYQTMLDRQKASADQACRALHGLDDDMPVPPIRRKLRRRRVQDILPVSAAS